MSVIIRPQWSFRLCIPFMLCVALTLLTACGKSHAPNCQYPPLVKGSSIAASAQSQLGRPYAYGGSSPSSGFDCSGLVYWACAKNGVTVPRMSRDQANAGIKIKRSEMRPGDIVVFKIPWSGYHTGIYIGQNRFIHSPKPRTRVRVESLSNAYWNKRFVTARRVAHP